MKDWLPYAIAAIVAAILGIFKAKRGPNYKEEVHEMMTEDRDEEIREAADDYGDAVAAANAERESARGKTLRERYNKVVRGRRGR